ncbi:MAG: hypothetical protein ACRCUY_02445 [Thermoguttaceae bacterium]
MTKKKSKPTEPQIQPLTHEQVDKLFAKLKRNLGDFSVLNDIIFKHLFGEPGKAEPRLMSLINAVRKQMQQPLITKVTMKVRRIIPPIRATKSRFSTSKRKTKMIAGITSKCS